MEEHQRVGFGQFTGVGCQLVRLPGPDFTQVLRGIRIEWTFDRANGTCDMLEIDQRHAYKKKNQYLILVRTN